MAQENQDANFRQEITKKIIDEGLDKVEVVSNLSYYERLLFGLENTEKKNNNNAMELIRSEVLKNVQQVYDTLTRSIDELNDIYSGLSQANLNPASTLFTVKEPVFISEEKTLSPKKAIFYAVLIWVLVEGCILTGVLKFNSFRRKKGSGPES